MNYAKVAKALNAPPTTVFPAKPNPTAEEARHNFYLDFIGEKMTKENRDWLDKEVMDKLHTIPMPDKDVGSYQAPKINSQAQCDVL